MESPMSRITLSCLLAVLLAVWIMPACSQPSQSDQQILRFNESLAAENGKDIPKALQSLEIMVDEAQSDYLINLRLGWLHYLNRDYEKSVQFYKKALDLTAQQSIEAMLGLVLPLAAQSEWAQVEDLYQKILRLDSGHYTANLRLGQIYLNRGEFARAQKYFAVILKRYPGDYEANLSGGWNAYYSGDAPAARKCFEQALMLSPGDTSASRGAGLVR
jgi:tetratricopeptide (TPR) repeat protein